LTKVEFMDDDEPSQFIENPNRVTEAVVGLCLYDDDSMETNILYPWHRIKRLVRGASK
jgi:hypothetical protein